MTLKRAIQNGTPIFEQHKEGFCLHHDTLEVNGILFVVLKELKNDIYQQLICPDTP